MKHWPLVASAVFAIVVVVPNATADEWDDAAKSVVRLAPAEFRSVPAAVIDALTTEGCTVPQATAFEAGKHNVIRGRFAFSRQLDYAALCSKNGSSHIMIVWGGPKRCASHLGEAEDKDYLQSVTQGIDYSRAIYPATQKTIAYYRREIGGPKPPDRTHDGIEDSFLGKTSGILYCAKGQWQSLQGMD